MERHYGMDWLRIGAFGLLIFYHIGMFFVPWDWHVKTAQPADWVAVPMLATNAWRIPLLFVVSGFASAALFARSPRIGAFLGNRTARLLVPTIFAMAVIIPPQLWIELQFKHDFSGDFLSFWLHDYFRFSAIEGIVVPTWQHLWFVVYLWAYTLVLGALLALPQGWRDTARRLVVTALSGGRILLVPLALLLARLVIGWPGPDETHALLDDGFAHTLFLPVFLFGFLLCGAEPLWEGIRRWWRVAAALAVVSYLIVAGLELQYPGDTVAPRGLGMTYATARTVQCWTAIIALIGLADAHWNRDHPWRRILVEAVFPFYIIHQTIIVVLGWYLLPLALPPLVEFGILLGATGAGCWLFYRVGREVPVLRQLIGLRGVNRV